SVLTAITLISLFTFAPVKCVKAEDKTAGDSTASEAENGAKSDSAVSQVTKAPRSDLTSATASRKNPVDTNDTLNLKDGNQSSSDATAQNKRQHLDNTAQTQTAGSPEKNLSFQ